MSLAAELYIYLRYEDQGTVQSQTKLPNGDLKVTTRNILLSRWRRERALYNERVEIIYGRQSLNEFLIRKDGSNI
jgi:hypothetical protein